MAGWQTVPQRSCAEAGMLGFRVLGFELWVLGLFRSLRLFGVKDEGSRI